MKLINQVLQRGCRLAFMSLIVLSGIFVLLVATQPAQAATQTIPFTVSCNPAIGEVCSPSFLTSVAVMSAGPITLNYTASPNHCSPVKVDFFVDGGDSIFTSPFLNAGQSTGPQATSSLIAGFHTVAVRATGEVAGCNSGDLGSWGGTLTVSGSLGDQCSSPTVGQGTGPVGNATGTSTCGVVITVTAVNALGTATAYTVSPTNPNGDPTNNGNPYDGTEDTLVGVVNNDPTNALTQLPITSSEGFPALGFDGDGPCAYNSNDCFDGAAKLAPNPAPACSGGSACYEGPDNTFTVTNVNNGTINFRSPLPANGGSTWLALEGSPNSLIPPTMQVMNTPPTNFNNNPTTDTIVAGVFDSNPGNLVEGDADFPGSTYMNFPANNPTSMQFRETNRFVSNCGPYTVGTPFATCIPFDHAGNDAMSGTPGNGAKYEIICSDGSNPPNFSEDNCPTLKDGTFKHIRFVDRWDFPKDSNGNKVQPAMNPGTTFSAIHWYPNLGGANSTSWGTSAGPTHPDCTNVFTNVKDAMGNAIPFACDFEDAAVNLAGDGPGTSSDSKKGDYLFAYNIPMLCSAVKVNTMPVNTACTQGNSVFFTHSPLTFDFLATPAKCPSGQTCGNGWVAAPVNDVFYTFDAVPGPDLPGATDFEDTIFCPGTGCPATIPNGVDCGGPNSTGHCSLTSGTPGGTPLSNVEFTTAALPESEGQYLLQYAARDTVKITERNTQILTSGPCPNPLNDPPAIAPTTPCYSTKLFNARITVDNTAPTVTNLVLTPNTQIPGKTITASYSCADNGNNTVALNSGLASCGTNLNLNNGAQPGPLGPLQLSDAPFTVPQANGPQTYKVTATDVAGNTFTASANYFAGYQFFGFFAPLNDPNPSNTVGPFTPPIIVNTIKSKQAVPIKWQVKDGNGVGVTGLTLKSAGGTVEVNAYMSGVCTNPGALDTTQITVTDVGSGLQDLGGGNYQLNGKSFPQGCIDLVVNPGDGTQHHAYLLSR